MTQVFKGFENTAFSEVVVGESGFGATEARMIGSGFAGLSVPKDAVAAGAGERASAADFIVKTTFLLAEMTGSLG
jgi:hypothetical protein